MAKLQEQALAISGQDCVLIARRHVSSEFARVWAWDVAFAMSRPVWTADPITVTPVAQTTILQQ